MQLPTFLSQNHIFSKYAPQLSLILITMIWGGTFITVQYALNFSSPMFFVGCRFLAATIIVGLLSWSDLKGMTKRDLYAGSLIGLTIAIGYGTQTIGLKSISSSESAFLTALYVPLVPILLLLVFRKIPHLMTLIGVSFAFIGLVFLTGNGFGQISLNFGQSITILGSIAIAMEIILISYFASKVNLRRVTVIQLAAASLLAFASMPLVGEYHLPQFSWVLIAVAIGLGLASAVIQLTMNWAQRSVAPSQAAIIYAVEPIWAAIFGRIAGERLPILALVGGLFVVLGVIVSELKPKFLNKISSKKELK